MIIYVNYNKQTGEISVDQNEPIIPNTLELNTNTVVDSDNNLSFEISFNEGVYAEQMGYRYAPDNITPSPIPPGGGPEGEI